MKAKLEFGLENAVWPALLLEDNGVIRAANRAAGGLFGSVVEGESTLLSAIWAPHNEWQAEQFLGKIERTNTMPVVLKFKVKGGMIVPFRTHVCSLTRDGQKYFLFQLFTDHATPSPSTPLPALDPGTQSVEAGVAQKQKLDCAMQMIRTVVLDFNNALTSILGHASLLLGKVEPSHPWRNSLVEIEKSAEKAAEVAHDLAAFTRQEKDTRSLTAGNINTLLQRTVEMFPVPPTLKMDWKLELESKVYTVHFDEAKMQQAILKILENSVQAVGERPCITVRSRNIEVAEPLNDCGVAVASGYYVAVEIADNGCGIHADVLPRIFEPFFTTKPNHRGLGLAWVYGIVANHGGCVSVNSSPGQGATVRLYLPALKRFVKERAFKHDELTGNQTILVVDDEALMLTMGQTVLSSFGYRVLTAINGEKALDIVKQYGSKIDLVITDLVMPKMSGREFIERLRQMEPRARVLCCSGYVRPTTSEEDDMYLQKPFTSQDLLRKVKLALSQLDLT